MNENDSLEWCELLSIYNLSYNEDGEKTYKELVEIIRSSADGAFDICDSAPCRHRNAILPVKDVSWDYLYQCMKYRVKISKLSSPEALMEYLCIM